MEKDEFRGFAKGNVIKYVWRYEDKNGLEDLKKARWYLDLLIFSMENEAAILEGLSIAQAARACGGVVVAQVKRLAPTGEIDPRIVKIPGMYVDYLVVDPEQKQHTLAEYDPSLSGETPSSSALSRLMTTRATTIWFPSNMPCCQSVNRPAAP